MNTPIVPTITDDLISELEAAANNAATQGVWTLISDDMGNEIDSDYGPVIEHTSFSQDEDMAFIAKARPAVILALLAERAELKRQNKEVRTILSDRVINETLLTGFVANGGGFTIGLEGGACALLAQAFGEQLYSSDAENYIEAQFESPDYPGMGTITVTVKRETGKTPHELRVIAENERDELKRNSRRYDFIRDKHNDEFSDIGVSNGNLFLAKEDGDLDLDSSVDELIEAMQELPS